MNHPLSHMIRKFNRFELKYLTSLQRAEEFKQDLAAYLVPDDHGGIQGGYGVASLYYDSPDRRFFWEKVDGIKFRRKLRIRYYENNLPLESTSPVFVEIKQRTDRVLQKRRVVLPYHEALTMCAGREFPAQYAPQDRPVLEEMMDMLWSYNLSPASIIRYQRQAFMGMAYDTGLRVTFDTNLQYQVNPYDPDALRLDGLQNCLPLFPPNWAVIEIKVNERIPYWLTELTAAHNLSLVRVSKYCRSIELSQNLAFASRLSAILTV